MDFTGQNNQATGTGNAAGQKEDYVDKGKPAYTPTHKHKSTKVFMPLTSVL